MNIEKNGNKLKVTHILKSNETYKIQKSSKYESINIFKRPQVCIGYSSKTYDNYHVILLDYDHIHLSVVVDDIKFIQEKFNLPTAYIFTTGMWKKESDYIGNFHSLIPSKHLASEVVEIMKHTHIDKNFLDSPIRNDYRSWILRLSGKDKRKRPSFVKFIQREGYFRGNREISGAHVRLISKLYPKIKIPLGETDKGTILKFQEYETSS